MARSDWCVSPTSAPTTAKRAEWIVFHATLVGKSVSRGGSCLGARGVAYRGGVPAPLSLILSDYSDSPTKEEELRGFGKSELVGLVEDWSNTTTLGWGEGHCDPGSGLNKTQPASARPDRCNTNVQLQHGAPPGCVRRTPRSRPPTPPERALLWAPRAPRRPSATQTVGLALKRRPNPSPLPAFTERLTPARTTNHPPRTV